MPRRETVRRLTRHKAWRKRRPGPVSFAGEPAAVTFPATALRSRARIALGADLTQSYLTWNWLDITDRIRWDDGVEIAAGRREQSDQVDASLARLKADNRDSLLSRKNPLGPYFGLLGKAIPIWISLDPGSGFADMFFGFIVDPAKRWDRSATDSVVLVTAHGLLHLLQRRQPLRSPMFYSVSGAADGDYVPHTYHPLEDGANATQAASGLAGGTPATVTGDVVFASAEDLAGSFPLPFLDEGAIIFGTIPAYSGTEQWFYQVALRIDLSPSVETTYLEIDTPGGDQALWRLYIEPGASDTIWFVGLDSAGAPTGTGSGVPLVGGSPSSPSEDDFYGRWWFYSLYAYVDPSDGFVYGGLSISDNGEFAGSSAGSGSDTVFGTATRWRIYGGNGIAAGHAAFFTDPTFGVFQAVTNAGAMGAWAGEMAHERVARLCREQRINLRCEALTSTVLGPQPRGTLLEVLRVTEKADQGVLYEHEFGLAYQSLSQRYNPEVTFTVDVALGQLADDLEPDDNDLRYHNQWTASRPDGSEATVQGRDGVAGVALEATDLLYPAKDAFAVQTDEQLVHVAGWLVHRDSLEEDYWPNVAINLAAHPELIPSWLAMGHGQRLQVLNVMDQAGIDTIDALREGYAQRWNSREWEVVMNTAPSATYQIGVAGDSTTPGSWAQTGDGTKLINALGVGETDPLVWSDGPVFSTLAADLTYAPLSVTVGGEVMPVTAITAVVRDSFTRSESNQWATPDIGPEDWDVSGTATNYSVNGSEGEMLVGVANSGRMALIDTGSTDGQAVVYVPVPALATGASYFVYLFLRATDFSNGYYARIGFDTAGNCALRMARFAGAASTLLGSGVNLGAYSAAQVWGLRFDVQGTQLRAKAWNAGGTEPSFWYETVTDSAFTTGTLAGPRAFANTGNTNVPYTQAFDDFDVVNPQQFTVTRSLAKAHDADAPLTVYRPLIAAL